jgi:hypothetical protein
MLRYELALASVTACINTGFSTGEHTLLSLYRRRTPGKPQFLVRKPLYRNINLHIPGLRNVGPSVCPYPNPIEQILDRIKPTLIF